MSTTQFTIERLPAPVVIAGRPSFEFAMVIPGHPDRYLVSRDHLMKEFGGDGTWEGFSVPAILGVLDYLGREPEVNSCVYSGFDRARRTEPIHVLPLRGINSIMTEVAEKVGAITGTRLHWMNVLDSEVNPHGHYGRFLSYGPQAREEG